MVVKKYFGNTTRDALRQVREELGADALILSNRPTLGGGVEIMAVADADVANLASTLATASTSRHPPRNVPANRTASPISDHNAPVKRALARTYTTSDAPVIPSLASTNEAPIIPHSASPIVQPPKTTPVITEEVKHTPSEARATALEHIPVLHTEPMIHQQIQLEQNPSQPDQHPSEPADQSSELKEIGEEIKQLRSLLQGQLATFAWATVEEHSPNRAELHKQLLATGLSANLSRQLIEKMPNEYDGKTALKWARSALLHNLKCVDSEHDLIDRGGILAFVGPTGVGKTTTIAKLAARATQKFGTHNVALITTDNYRVGAQDQLRAYGKILGVPVFFIQNANDASLPIAELTHRHIVFVDTAGMCQRDTRIFAQTELFSTLGLAVERILVIAANADGRTLEDVVKRYRGEGLKGCIMTKIDESVALGVSLDVIIRNRLNIYYVTNGQRVPEDLHLANGHFLIDRALRAPQHHSVFSLQADEFPIMNAAHAGWL